jgi:hypothetical protein
VYESTLATTADFGWLRGRREPVIAAMKALGTVFAGENEDGDAEGSSVPRPVDILLGARPDKADMLDARMCSALDAWTIAATQGLAYRFRDPRWVKLAGLVEVSRGCGLLQCLSPLTQSG